VRRSPIIVGVVIALGVLGLMGVLVWSATIFEDDFSPPKPGWPAELAPCRAIEYSQDRRPGEHPAILRQRSIVGYSSADGVRAHRLLRPGWQNPICHRAL
jgi:hypothetical protein